MLATTLRVEDDSKCAARLRVRTPSPLQPAILVVEDDWSVRRFICAVLKHATKAAVIEAADPESAYSKTAELAQPIDVLISDIHLSARTTGIDLAHEIVARHPSAKVLLMSAADCAQSDIPPEWSFLAKPFPIAVFLDCVTSLCPSLLPEDPLGSQSAA